MRIVTRVRITTYGPNSLLFLIAITGTKCIQCQMEGFSLKGNTKPCSLYVSQQRYAIKGCQKNVLAHNLWCISKQGTGAGLQSVWEVWLVACQFCFVFFSSFACSFFSPYILYV